MKHLIWLIAILFSCQTQKDKYSQLTRQSYFSEITQAERDYFVYLPKEYHSSEKRFPVMLFLHGNGERGNGKDELDFVIKHGPLYEAWIQKKDLPFIIIAPQLPMFGMDTLADYIADRTKDEIPKRMKKGVPARPEKFPTPQLMNGELLDSAFLYPKTGWPWGWHAIENELLAMLDYTIKNYKAESSQVYITGLSYGGHGTWYMASTYPDRFAAAAPVVAWGHPELMPALAEKNMPLWVFFGGRDAVVPTKYFYPGLNKLEALGHTNLRVTNFEDLGHDAWTRAYAGEDLYNWMLQYAIEAN